MSMHCARVIGGRHPNGCNEQSREGREAERIGDDAGACGKPESADREIGDEERPEEARLS